MADYREISQQYAQGAIKAAILLNGGASVAVLSQFDKLKALDLLESASLAVTIWVLGIAIGAITWIFAFKSTRYYDRFVRKEGCNPQGDRDRSNNLMKAGEVTVILSFLMFLAGALLVSVCTYTTS